MGAGADAMTHDSADYDAADKSPAQIERDIDDTRARLGAAIRSIEYRLSPERLIEQGTHLLRSLVSDAGKRVSHPREQQIPLMLLGAGLGWLLLGRGAQKGETVPDDALAYARTKTGPLNAGSGTPSRLKDMVNQSPMVVGMLGGLAGAAIAVMLPKARADELLTHASDTVRVKAEALVSDTVVRTKQAAMGAATAVADAVNDTISDTWPRPPRPARNVVGALGDQTEEQNLNQPGSPTARITEAEARDAFALRRS
jgi:hypothetical protein